MPQPHCNKGSQQRPGPECHLPSPFSPCGAQLPWLAAPRAPHSFGADLGDRDPTCSERSGETDVGPVTCSPCHSGAKAIPTDPAGSRKIPAGTTPPARASRLNPDSGSGVTAGVLDAQSRGCHSYQSGCHLFMTPHLLDWGHSRGSLFPSEFPDGKIREGSPWAEGLGVFCRVLLHPPPEDQGLDFLVGHRTEHHTVRRSTG